MNKKGIVKSIAAFAVASALLLIAVRPDSVLAYFTTHADAVGQHVINLYYETHINEDVTAGIKTVSISSEADSMDVYVRVKVFSEVEVDVSGTNWDPIAADDYYYYNQILKESSATTDLKIQLHDPESLKDKYKAGDVFDVIVVYETTPVIYDTQTEVSENPLVPTYAYNSAELWSRKADVSKIVDTVPVKEN